MNTLLDVWGADSVQNQVDGISRKKTVCNSEWQVCFHATIIGSCVQNAMRPSFIQNGLRWEIDVDQIRLKCGQAFRDVDGAHGV